MLDVLIASRSAGSYGHEPMTAAGVDAHPGADRIWATIAAIRNEIEHETQEESYREGFADGAACALDLVNEFKVELDDRISDLLQAIKHDGKLL